MDRIYFYEKTNGEIVIESPDSAWRVHKQFLKKYWKYVGWSDGRFIKKFKTQALPKDAHGLSTVDPETRVALQEAVQQEIEFARNNPDRTPPRDRSLKEMHGGAFGSVGEATTEGLTMLINRMR